MSLLFKFSIPSDASFLQPLQELAIRIAEYAGYPKDDALELGATVTEGASQAIKSTKTETAPIDILFQTDEQSFLVTLTYEQASPASKGPEQFVCRRNGPISVCQLVRDLPIESGG